VSVCGTVVLQLKLRGFSWEPGITHLGLASQPSVITPWLSPADLPTGHAYTLEPGRPTPGCVNLLRPPIALQVGAGILTSFPSVTTLVLTLGADSPCADARGAGNLGLTASGTFTRFIATHVSIRTSDTSSRVHTPPSPAYGTLSYHPGVRSQLTEVSQDAASRCAVLLANPCSILAISWYSSRQACHRDSEMYSRSRQ
jgi:hypothetical protein